MYELRKLIAAYRNIGANASDLIAEAEFAMWSSTPHRKMWPAPVTRTRAFRK